ncbi:MAG TPA: DnaB-like helicase C-terminal domain-containing protein [Candidatus Paceibacterota bacterium]
MTDLTTIQAQREEQYRSMLTKRMEMEHTAEENLCGAVIRGGNEVYSQVRDIVKPASFRIQTLGWLWEAFESLFERNLRIDQFTVADELERVDRLNDFISGAWSGRLYLSNLRDNGEPRNILTYAMNVSDYSNKRYLEKRTTEWYEWSVNGRRDKDIVADINADLARIQIFGAADEFTKHVSAGLSKAWDWSDRAGRGEIPGVQTGFVDLDKMLVSLMPANVYLVAARPGAGKSALLLTIALFLAKKGYKVAIFSLEMNDTSLAMRMIAQEARINLKQIISGKMDAAELTRYAAAVELIEKLNITVNDMAGINVSEIRQTSRRIKANGGLDIVIVDYLQLASPDDDENKRYNREQEVSAISRGLRYLASELNIPVLAAAQMSRAVEQRADRRPVLSDLRESGSLEQDSYCVMFIHDPEDVNKQGIVELIVAKHRNGEIGSVELLFKREYTLFLSATTRMFSTQLPEVTNEREY